MHGLFYHLCEAGRVSEDRCGWSLKILSVSCLNVQFLTKTTYNDEIFMPGVQLHSTKMVWGQTWPPPLLPTTSHSLPLETPLQWSRGEIVEMEFHFNAPVTVEKKATLNEGG